MEVSSSYTNGLHKAGENLAVWMALNKPLDGTSRIMAIGLPHTAEPQNYFLQDYVTDDTQIPAANGFTVVMPAAIPHMMGNDAAVDSLQKAIDYARAELNASDEPVFLLGMSMGGLLVCNWALQHLDDVAAIALVTPALDLDFARTLSAHYDSDVIAAYGGSVGTFNAAKPTHSPVLYADDLSDIPVKIWYSTNDTLTPLSMMVPFALGHGSVDLISLGEVGHNPSGALGQDLVDFYNAHL